MPDLVGDHPGKGARPVEWGAKQMKLAGELGEEREREHLLLGTRQPERGRLIERLGGVGAAIERAPANLALSRADDRLVLFGERERVAADSLQSVHYGFGGAWGPGELTRFGTDGDGATRTVGDGEFT